MKIKECDFYKAMDLIDDILEADILDITLESSDGKEIKIVDVMHGDNIATIENTFYKYTLSNQDSAK